MNLTPRHFFLAILFFGVVANLPAEEKTVELVLTSEPTAPGRIVLWKSNLPDHGYATGATRGTVGWFGGENRLWVQFDLDTIPQNAFVISAVLRLWQNDRVGRPQDHVFDLCTVAKHVDSATCSWNGPVQGLTWTKPGANHAIGPTADRSLPVASCTITQHPHVWRQWDVTTAVQAMLKENTNNGFLIYDRHLRTDDPNRTSVIFAMPESPNLEHRPVLAIRYSDTPVERTEANSLMLPPPKTVVVKTRQAYRDGETPLPAYHMTKLATISQAAPWSNFSATLDRGHAQESAAVTRILLKFGQLLPTPSPATQVRVRIHVAAGVGNASLQLRRLTEDWHIAEVSWNERRWGLPWKAAGGSAEEIRMPCEIAMAGADQVLAFDVTDWFQDWLKHPDRNYGVMFTAAAGPVRVATDQTENTSFRPQLEVYCGLTTQ